MTDGFSAQYLCRYCGRSVTWELPFCLACRFERWEKGVCLWCDAAVERSRKVGGVMVTRCDACKANKLPDAPSKGELKFWGRPRTAEQKEKQIETRRGRDG